MSEVLAWICMALLAIGGFVVAVAFAVAGFAMMLSLALFNALCRPLPLAVLILVIAAWHWNLF